MPEARHRETIAEILAHPRYREFAQAVSEQGRQVAPDFFPWRCMGMATEAFLALPLKFEDGTLMSEGMKVRQLAIVRTQEALVEDWWQWWRGWEYLAKPARGDAAVRSAPVTAAGEQGQLF